MRAIVDPKITELFLLSQDDVQDASVWISGQKLHAHVTQAKNSELTELRLKRACEDQIGSAQTPVEIILLQATARN